MTLVLLDNSYVNFYRVFATKSYISKAGLELEVDQLMYDHYMSMIDVIAKKIKVPYSSWICVRDSCVENIWRNDFINNYKERDCNSDVGKYIKLLNEFSSRLFGAVVKIDGLEADDIIAVMCKLISTLNYDKVIVVSADKDFYQLYKYDDIYIYDIRSKKILTDIDPVGSLEKKIIKGDPSDNIKGVKYPYNRKGDLVGNSWKYITNKILIDFDYIPRKIQDLVIRELYKKGMIDYNKIDYSFIPRHVQLGLCCINNALKKDGIFCNRKPNRKTIQSKGIEYLYGECRKNLEDIIELIKWNSDHGFRVFRMCSGLLPHYTDPEIDFGSGMGIFQDLFLEIGKTARFYKQRLTFHPDQFNILSSPDERDHIVIKTIRELDYQAEMLDRMEMDQDSVMVVHGGGIYNNKQEAISRWVKNYYRLTERTRRRLVLENDEKCYNIEDCLAISREVGIPVVFDAHHYNCYQILKDPLSKSPRDYIPQILETWGRIKPKFHVSESGGKKICSHSDYIENIPDYLLEIPSKYGIDIDIMVEAKAKNEAIDRLHSKYPFLDPTNGLSDE